jgi:hypothetical protein
MDGLLLPEVGAGGEEELLKSLSAGYGTNAADFTGGRALIPEDCESTMINAMREQMDDFKLMNTLKKTPVKSTVHQFNVRSNAGDEDLGFVEEGGVSPANMQDIKRAFREMKYIQKKGEVTEQMRIVESFEDAYVAEKLAATISVLKTAEKYCFHGDSAVVPKQFDGLIAQVKSTPLAKRNILDLRGQSIQSAGDRIFTEMATLIADRGGAANKVFYPLILGDDIQGLCHDRLRFGVEDEDMTAVWKTYPTLYSPLTIAGNDAGPDKLFRPKNKIKPGGIADKLPNPPDSVTASSAANPNSKFLAADAGNYNYTVYSVNESGISEGKALSAAVAVSAGAGVTLTITPNALKPGTGFIVCRSAKNGSEVMEMARIGIDALNADTAYVDLNEDLPGTAEMLFITEKKIQSVVEFFQLLPLRLYPLYPIDRLVTPFVMALWGTPALKIPEWCGIVKNIQYKGGLTY